MTADQLDFFKVATLTDSGPIYNPAGDKLYIISDRVTLTGTQHVY